MAATQGDTWLADEPVRQACLDEARREDAWWEAQYMREHYYRAGLDYDDYAAAFCVGYVGHCQYGGTFEDSEKSMLSNWVRLKGDSRLGVEEALLAMRAAWERREALHAQPAPDDRASESFLDYVRDLAGGAEWALPAQAAAVSAANERQASHAM